MWLLPTSERAMVNRPAYTWTVYCTWTIHWQFFSPHIHVALNSYLTFCKIHNFPIEPTQQTLSFFVVYMSAHIKPDSVNSYLSGICNQLEVYFPDVHKNQNSILVSHTLAGCHRCIGTPVWRKWPLSTDDLITVQSQLGSTPQHNEKLFLAILFTGFHGLFCLGELTFPDRVASHDYCKVMLCHTVDITQTTYSLLLPGHKANHFFEGNIVIIQKTNLHTNPHNIFTSYISSCDSLHPLKPELWLHKSGTMPTSCATSSHQILQANPCKQVEPPSLLKLVYHPTSFKPLGAGHQIPSIYT